MTGAEVMVAERKGRGTKTMGQVVAWEHLGSFSNCKKLNLESERENQYRKEKAKPERMCREWK